MVGVHWFTIVQPLCLCVVAQHFFRDISLQRLIATSADGSWMRACSVIQKDGTPDVSYFFFDVLVSCHLVVLDSCYFEICF